MALYKGEKKLALWQGDRKPYGLFKGNRQVAGAVKKHKTGTKEISFESVYKAKIPSLKLKGMGFQGLKTGKNILPPDYHDIKNWKKAPFQFDDYGYVIKGLKAGHKYMFSGNRVKGEQSYIQIMEVQPNGSFDKVYYLFEGEQTEANINNEVLVPVEGNTYMIWIPFKSALDGIIKLQLEEGDVKTSYEDYRLIGDKPLLKGTNLLKPITQRRIATVGTSLSPNDPRTFTGNQFLVGCTLNGYWTSSMLPIFLYDEKSDIYSVQVSNHIYGIGFDYKVKPNEKYYFNYANPLDKVGYDENCGFGFFNAEGINIGYKYYNSSTGVIEIPPNCEWLLICLAPYEINKVVDFEKPMLSLKPTHYEPYIGGTPAPNPMHPVEPVWNANNSLDVEGTQLIPFPYADGMHKETNGITFDVKKDGRIVANGTATDDAYFFINTKGIALNDSTATISGGKNRRKRIEVKTKEGFLNTDDDGKLTFGANNTEGILINVKVNEICDNLTFKPMLNKGNEPQPWQPYVKPQHKEIPLLRGIEDTEYADEYEVATGDRKVVFGKVIFDDKDNWKPYNFEAGSGWYASSKGYIFIDSPSKYGGPSMSNQLRLSGYGSNVAKDGEYYLGNNSLNFVWSKFDTKEKLLAHLKENPIEIYYILPEPIIEHLDDEHLTQDWSGTITQLGGDCGVGDMEAVVYEEIE